jgi:uncharacterized protein (DUF2236 family)
MSEPVLAADPGLLGPDSVTWNMHADPSMWVAGITSLYLQALHPRAVAGVVQNSNFQEDPLGRLARTANFVGLSTYGPKDQVAEAAAKVRSIHRSLRGRDQTTGETFRVDDPELLRWVHCAEVSSFLSVVRMGGYPVTDAQADRYLDEQRQTATLVGLHADDVPGSREQMRAYFADMRPALARTPDSDIVYRFLHRPPLAFPLVLGRPVYTTLLGHLAYSLLPSWGIALHGRDPYPRDGAIALLRTLRSAAFGVPRWLRWGKPEPYAIEAITRLGPSVTPSVRRLPKI